MQLGRFFSIFAKWNLVIAAMSVSILAGADEFESTRDDHYNYDYRNNNCYSNVPCGNYCQGDTCCGFPCSPAPACNWAYNPPAYPSCGCDMGCNNCCGSFLDSFYFRSDFLWWRACEEGLELGTEEFVESFTEVVTPERSIVYNRSHEKKPNFKYDPGFRIGFGNHCACGCWDFAVNWTNFHTKAKVNGFSFGDVTFFPYWERVSNAIPFNAFGQYKLDLDLIDLEFGHKFYVANCFSLRPQFGLRFARVHQTYRAEFDAEGPSDEILSSYISEIKTRSNFLAVGPRAGLEVEVDIGCGISLFGCGAGAVMFGKFDNNSKEYLKDFTTLTVQEIGQFTYESPSARHRCSRLFTDLAFGVKWTRCFEWCNRCHPVSLAFAWEHHGFFAMNTFNFAERGFVFPEGVEDGPGDLKAAQANKRGDLFTQGLTVSLTFGF